MKTIVLQLIASSGLMLLLSSCVCEEADFLVSPEEVENAFQVTEVRYFFGNDDVTPNSLIISFNDNLDTSSVQLNKTLFVEGDQLDYNNTFSSFYNTLTIGLCALGCQADICEFQITLRSNPNILEGIRNTQGDFLDGDKDGQPGGDYRIVLEVERCP